MTERGIVYVAYGEPARREAAQSIASLRQAGVGLEVTVVSDRPLGAFRHVYAPREDPGARLAKLSLDSLSPYDQTCYLDADTRVRGSLDAGWRALAQGFDLCLALSGRQGGDALGNCPEADRHATWEAIGCDHLLGLQAGCLFWRRSELTAALFACWRKEWARYRGRDQAALLRALNRVPVRCWLLGSQWHGAKGEVIEHRFGAMRRAA